MFTEKKKEEFIIIHDELDAIIKKIVIAKAEYGEHPFDYDSHLWSYDDNLFEIEAEEKYIGGCNEPNNRWLQVTWEEIFDVENIVAKLNKEGEERKRKAAEKKLLDEANAQKEKLAREHREYERLKTKFEKS